MIISVHIPKTAGTTFGEQLQRQFEHRLLRDYHDWPENSGPEGLERSRASRQAVVAQRDEIASSFDAVHGHFLPSKYLDVIPGGRVVAFVRDPCQHAISAYAYAHRVQGAPRPDLQRFLERRMTLIEFIEAFPNLQSLYLEEIGVEGLAAVGLTERYEASVALFSKVFGLELPPVEKRNVNPERTAGAYPISDEIRRAIERARAPDVELYRRASERFEDLLRRYDL